MIESLKKNKIGILLMCISSVCACVGQLLWKMSENSEIWLILVGFCIYGIGALIMIIAYKFGSLSVLQPFLSLNYVLSTILGAAVAKIAGVLIIITGVMLIGGGDNK